MMLPVSRKNIAIMRFIAKARYNNVLYAYQIYYCHSILYSYIQIYYLTLAHIDILLYYFFAVSTPIRKGLLSYPFGCNLQVENPCRERFAVSPIGV